MVKYVLTGASGALGSRVLQHLLSLAPASDIAVSLYNPVGASPAIRTSGVEIRQGDYTKPETLRTSFVGADKLFLVSYPALSANRANLHKAAIDAAKQAGVKHIFYTSLAHTDDSVATVMHSHLVTEKYLRESGMTYTILRETIYNEMWPLWMGLKDLKVFEGEGDVTVPIPVGDGGVAWASQDDLAEGIARIMVTSTEYENKTVNLTGLEVATLSDVAQMISQVLKRRVTTQIIPEDVFVEYQKTRLPEETIREGVTSYRALARGELARADTSLREVLGRDLKKVEETVEGFLTGKENFRHVPL